MSLANHLKELRKKHELLDTKICELARSPSACSLKIRELKKEKLRLKEEIERLSRPSTPEAELVEPARPQPRRDGGATLYAEGALTQLNVANSGGRRISDEHRAELAVAAGIAAE